MPQVNVTIAGKAYRMACGEGEEPHLEGLARAYDGKIQEMRQTLHENGTGRPVVQVASGVVRAREDRDTLVPGPVESAQADRRLCRGAGDEVHRDRALRELRGERRGFRAVHDELTNVGQVCGFGSGAGAYS